MSKPSSDAQVRRAQLSDVDSVAPLFDAYRQFYRLDSDLALCRDYLQARLVHDESVIFIAEQGDSTVAFCQMYPTFSSLSAGRVWILYDLFVAPEARGLGLAQALMAQAESFARAGGASSLSLETARDNLAAQALYESRGYQRDNDYFSYSLSL